MVLGGLQVHIIKVCLFCLSFSLVAFIWESAYYDAWRMGNLVFCGIFVLIMIGYKFVVDEKHLHLLQWWHPRLMCTILFLSGGTVIYFANSYAEPADGVNLMLVMVFVFMSVLRLRMVYAAPSTLVFIVAFLVMLLVGDMEDPERQFYSAKNFVLFTTIALTWLNGVVLACQNEMRARIAFVADKVNRVQLGRMESIAQSMARDVLTPDHHGYTKSPKF